MKRRDFVGAAAFAAGLAPYKAAAFELEELTIADLAKGLRSGRWTSRRLAELYLARIEALNLKGPQLRAVIEINPDALETADRLDRERKTDAKQGSLHGIPILIKDNINTRDRMSTSAGSLALDGSRAAKDAFAAARLRAGRPLILGKNQHEWVGQLSAPLIPSAAGVDGEGRPAIPTLLTATPRDQAPVRAPAWRRICAPPPLDRRRMVRSSVRRQ